MGDLKKQEGDDIIMVRENSTEYGEMATDDKFISLLRGYLREFYEKQIEKMEDIK